MNKIISFKRVLIVFCLVAITSALTTIINKFDIVKALTVGPSQTAEVIQHDGLDMHDGTVQKFGNTYYMYGGTYGCGFEWQNPGSKFCGFHVRTAPSLNGPWSAPKKLFDPYSKAPDGRTWQQVCLENGNSCWNPRMVQRSGWGYNDGAYILWFSSSARQDYYIMGCNKPDGDCGARPDGSINPPFGSTHQVTGIKSNAGSCRYSFNFIVDNNSLWMVCTTENYTIAIQQIDIWGANGTPTFVKDVASIGMDGGPLTESPAIYKDAATNKYILTYDDGACGYCTGTGLGYATSNSLLGPYTYPEQPNLSNWHPKFTQRKISLTTFGGQGMGVFTVDGQPYEWVDVWGYWPDRATDGARWRQQTDASLIFAPLRYQPSTRQPGRPLKPQFQQWPSI